MKIAAQFLSVVLSALLVSGQLPAQTASDLQISVLNSGGDTTLAVQVADTTGAPVADAAVLFRLPETGPTATFPDGTHAAVAYTDQSGKASVSDLHWSSESGLSTIRITATRGTSRGGMLLDRQVGPAPAAAIAPQAAAINPQPTAPAPQPAAPVSAPSTPVTASAPQPGTPSANTVPKPATNPDGALPRVSVTNAPTHDGIHSGGISKKWIILAVVAAGAGAGVAMMGKGKSSSASSTPSTSISIGAPTVSVGHP